MKEEEGVYGRNDPKEEDTGEPTARDFNPENIHPDHEKNAGELMEENRQKGSEKQDMGGMGRSHVPKEPPHGKKEGDAAATDEVPS
jgi:hypothetical protein